MEPEKTKSIGPDPSCKGYQVQTNGPEQSNLRSNENEDFNEQTPGISDHGILVGFICYGEAEVVLPIVAEC